MAPRTDRPTWLRSHRFLARSVAQPIQRFLHIEAAGGILLGTAALVALAWANSPWAAAYRDLWTAELSVDLAGHLVTKDLRHWINDGLMTLFFFVLGLEIKQELTTGLLALLGNRVPAELKILLLALAIVDDIGAIIVIAAFYSHGLDGRWAAVAALGLLLVAAAQRAGIRFLPVYVALGIGVWFATFESGIHATIAGVALGLLTPARPLLPQADAERIAAELSTDTEVTAGEVRDISFRLRESIPVTERLQDLLHPWTSYLIVPLFALANAGIAVSADALTDAATSPVTIGVVAGLVLGKLIGVAGAITLVTHLGLGRLPAGITNRHVFGMAAVAGIGFTVSIFVAGLAFNDPDLTDQAKIGVLVASTLAAALGSTILLAPGKPPTDPDVTTGDPDGSG